MNATSSERLLQLIGDIDPELVAAADLVYDDSLAFKSPTGPRKPTRQSRLAWVGMAAAGLAAIALGILIWAGQPTGQPTLPQGRPDSPIVANPTNPAGDSLVINVATVQSSRDIGIDGHFWYDLTEGQLAAVFGDFPYPLLATAHYSGDGSLVCIMAYRSDGGRIAMVDEAYVELELQIAPGQTLTDIAYFNYQPEVSMINGVAVTAGVFYGNANDGMALYMADFQRDGLAYSLTIKASDSGSAGPDYLLQVVDALTGGSAPDLGCLADPVIPELRDERLSLDAAYKDPDFGDLLPGRGGAAMPAGLVFESAHRFINQVDDSLTLFWSDSSRELWWQIRRPTDYDLNQLVSPADTDKYDMSLYPIPWAESVPPEYQDVVSNPVFRSEDLTLDMVQARAYPYGDKSQLALNFAVLDGDRLIEIRAYGLTPEQVWQLLQPLLEA